MNIYQKQRGVAAVELGIVLIPLVLLAFAITEFGRAVYEYNTVAKMTRDATRFLSGQGPGDPNDISAAKCLTVYGNKACTGVPLVPNLTTAMVNICDSTSCAGTHQSQPTGSGVINLVTVSVTGCPFTSLVPLFVPSMNFGSISTTMRQVL
jgi:Flp pilus assembly protein TadG